MARHERDERAAVRMDVAYEEPGRHAFCRALNLSTSGVFLGAADAPRVGEQVRVVLSLPSNGRFLRLQGRVVRHADGSEPTGFAVAFRNLDESTRHELGEFLREAAAPVR